jgi:hypothetical protein
MPALSIRQLSGTGIAGRSSRFRSPRCHL